MMESILRGEVRSGTEVKSCLTDRSTLRQKLSTENAEQRRIDRVLFVYALSKDVNEPLLKKTLDLVRGVDGRSPCELPNTSLL